MATAERCGERAPSTAARIRYAPAVFASPPIDFVAVDFPEGHERLNRKRCCRQMSRQQLPPAPCRLPAGRLGSLSQLG